MRGLREQRARKTPKNAWRHSVHTFNRARWAKEYTVRRLVGAGVTLGASCRASAWLWGVICVCPIRIVIHVQYCFTRVACRREACSSQARRQANNVGNWLCRLGWPACSLRAVLCSDCFFYIFVVDGCWRRLSLNCLLSHSRCDWTSGLPCCCLAPARLRPCLCEGRIMLCSVSCCVS